MTALTDSLVEARKAMDMPPLNGVGHAGKNGAREYKYALLSDVLKCVIPPLLENGVLLYQALDGDVLKTIVVKGDEQLVLDSRAVNMSGTSQEQGSAETYAKRYALCTVFCLSGIEDDDGFAASKALSQQKGFGGPPDQGNEVLRVAYQRMGMAVEDWCRRHGCDSPEEIQAKKDGIMKRREWPSQCRSLEYINSIVREFEDD